MDLGSNIVDIIKAARKPLTVGELQFILITSGRSSRASVEDINGAVLGSDLLEITSSGSIGLKVNPKASSFSFKLSTPIYNDYQDITLDQFLGKLLSTFESGEIRHPIHHFVSILILDHLHDLGLSNSIDNDASRSATEFRELILEEKRISSFINYLKRLNDLPIIQGVFNVVISDFESNDINLISTYRNVFELIVIKPNVKIDIRDLGIKVSRLISSRAFRQRDNSSSPEFIGRLVSQLSAIKTGATIYDPAVGIGTFFTELCYRYQTSDFNLIGVEINEKVASLCRLNLVLNGLFKHQIFCGDSLTGDYLPDGSADLVISNPPFGHSTARIEYRNKDWFPVDHFSKLPNEFALFFLQHMLKKVKKNGRIMEVVNDGVLFSAQSQQFRKHLLAKHCIEAVVSLPVGLYSPVTAIGTSLILLNFNTEHKNAIAFIDARDRIKVSIKNQTVTLSEEVANITIKEIADAVLKNASTHSLPKAIITRQVVEQNNFDLSPIRYTHPILLQISKAISEGERFVELATLLSTISTRPLNPGSELLPVIRIKDLFVDGKVVSLNEIKTDRYSHKDVSHVRILNESALIVSRVAGEIKPTIIKLEKGQSMLLHSNLTAYKIHYVGIDEEYLLGQLCSDLVRAQLEMFNKRTVGIRTINQSNFLKVLIPLPKLSDQVEWVAKHRKIEYEKDELISFIRNIPLIETSDGLKQEVEKFARDHYGSDNAEFRSVFEYDKFPFSKKDIESYTYVKKSKNNTSTVLLLDDDKFGIYGALEIADENIIDYKKCLTVRAYCTFLFRTYNYITRTSTNRQLERFAHTTKNFFAGIQSRLNRIVNSANPELAGALNKLSVESENTIQYYIQKGKERSDFTVLNQLQEIKNSISGIANFYLETDSLFKKVQAAEKKSFDIVALLNQLKQINPDVKLAIDGHREILVNSKPTLIEQALLDLIQNATKYSADNTCSIELYVLDGYILISIHNPVEVLISEEKYSALGKDWLKDEASQYIHYGLYQSFQAIKEADAEIELADYAYYNNRKSFKLMIKLQKALW